MARALGIDISGWKIVKSWDDVWNAGVRFIGMKATEGNTYLDPTLRKNREAFRRMPFSLGIYYHFSRPGSARKQAERFMDAVGDLRDNERMCLDLEGQGPTPDDPRRAIDWIEEFYETMMDAQPDRRPLIYTSYRIWRTIADPDWHLAPEVDLWAPRYSHTEPLIPKPWAKIVVGMDLDVFVAENNGPVLAPGDIPGKWVTGKVIGVDDPLGIAVTAATTVNDQPMPINTIVRMDGEGVAWRRTRPAWTFWQWSDGVDPEEHLTPGVGRCDLNYFRGDEVALIEYAKLEP